MNTATLPEQKTLSIVEKDPMEGLVSQAEYARTKKVSKVYIGRLVSDGHITLSYGKIDPELADKQIEEAFPNGMGEGKKKASSKKSSFSEAKTNEKRLQVSLLELNYQEKAGELVKAKDVQVAAFNEARKLRDNMLNIPDRIAALIAAEDDENAVRKIITDEIEKGLQNI
jgi:hypothetical protein